MSRKPIPESIQENILLRTRRRCCLCFWLDGRDEVKKGQIAHLDQNHENAGEDNLVFLCLEHHDEYDSTPSVSKGLREKEVKRWRDELYREMEYRFRTAKRTAFELCFVGIVFRGTRSVAVRFRLKNAGDGAVSSPLVSIRLPDGIAAEKPKRPIQRSNPFEIVVPEIELHGMKESRQDHFEPNGRVGEIKVAWGIHAELMSGHSVEFDGLSIPLGQFPVGTQITFDYRIDSKDTQPYVGQVVVVLSNERENWIDDTGR